MDMDIFIHLFSIHFLIVCLVMDFSTGEIIMAIDMRIMDLEIITMVEEITHITPQTLGITLILEV